MKPTSAASPASAAPPAVPPLWKQDRAWGVGIALAAFLMSSLTPAFDGLERRWYDHAEPVALPPADSAGPSKGVQEVAAIGIDDASIRQFGPWPWAGTVHARLVDQLSAAGARAIVYAAPLDGEMRDRNALVAAMVRSKRVVLSAQPSAANGQGRPADLRWPAEALIAPALAVGLGSVAPDADGVVRGTTLLVDEGNRALPSLPLLAATLARGLPASAISRLPDGRVAVDGQAVPTVRPSFANISIGVDREGRPPVAADSFADIASGKTNAARYKGRVVFVGFTDAAGPGDFGVAHTRRAPRVASLSEPELLANQAASLIDGRAVGRPAWGWALVVTAFALVAAYLGLWLERFATLSAVVITGTGAIALLAIEYVLHAQAARWVPLVAPAVAAVIGHAIMAARWRFEPAAGGTAANARPSASPPMATPPDTVPSELSEPAPSRPSVTLPPSMPGTPAPTREAPAGPPMPPRIGRYRIEGELGRGSSGTVYVGVPVQGGPRAAIKVLARATDFSDERQFAEVRSRFMREAETAARLRHPDIAVVLEAGTDRGMAFLAMELLPGHDLSAHIRAGALLPAVEVLGIVARVADALAHAHSQGVVHRDLKPSNIMIDPVSGLVKVMDFGIAQVADASSTRTGTFLGTPAYMSPEQLAGQRVDGRSDLYSLGVVLFQLLTGELPHAAPSMSALLYAIANSPATDLRSLRPELPQALADIVALALEKRPNVRYADGRQLAADLRAVAAQVPSTPAALLEPLVPPQDRRPGGGRGT